MMAPNEISDTNETSGEISGNCAYWLLNGLQRLVKECGDTIGPPVGVLPLVDQFWRPLLKRNVNWLCERFLSKGNEIRLFRSQIIYLWFLTKIPREVVMIIWGKFRKFEYDSRIRYRFLFSIRYTTLGRVERRSRNCAGETTLGKTTLKAGNLFILIFHSGEGATRVIIMGKPRVGIVG
jgi:hypothetical protein